MTKIESAAIALLITICEWLIAHREDGAGVRNAAWELKRAIKESSDEA